MVTNDDRSEVCLDFMGEDAGRQVMDWNILNIMVFLFDSSNYVWEREQEE